jgi:hypothetical protein
LKRCLDLSDTLFEVVDVFAWGKFFGFGIQQASFVKEEFITQLQRFQHIGPESFAQFRRVTRTIASVRKSFRHYDQQGLRIDAEIGGLAGKRLALIPVIKPMLAVIVVKREKPPNPHRRMPFG